MIIALSGCDAAGKSTIGELLVNRLREMGFSTEYHHFNQKFVLRPFFSFMREETKIRLNEKLFQRQRGYLRILPYALFLDTLAYLAYYKILKRNHVLVWDRYPPDSIPIWAHTLCDDPLIESLYYHFPNPDLVIFLDVPPDVSFERGKVTHVYDLSFYRMQRKRLLSILRKYRNAIIVNSNRPVNETFNDVSARLLKQDVFVRFRSKMSRGNA